MDYLTRIRARARGEEKNVPGFLHDKSRAADFVNLIGGPTPKVLRSFKDPEKFNFDGLPSSFVLKPTFSSSSLGVMVLKRREDGNFRDHMRHRDLSMAPIRSEQSELAGKHPKSRLEWIVEEKIEDAEGREVPDDFKFYTFQGQIGLVHRVIRNTPRDLHAYYDGDFEILQDPDEQKIWTHSRVIERSYAAPPDDAGRLLNLVRRISVSVPSPFVRVDMFNTPSGPVFGEFTLVPGTFFYEDREKMSPALSAQLGELWGEAERRLQY